MSAPNTGIVIAQWTTGSTARLTRLLLGFVPDYCRIFVNHEATNPSILEWFNKGGQTLPAAQQVPNPNAAATGPGTQAPSVISQWLDADDHLLLTGSTGVVTRVTSGIAAYFGGDLIAADNTIDSNPVHIFDDGKFAKAGLVTPAGISIPAASLTANGLNVGIFFRRVPGQKVAGLATS